MYSTTSALMSMRTVFSDTGDMVVAAVFSILAGGVALLGLGFAYSRLSLYIYNYGGRFRHVFGKKPFKGYHRFRSEEWNMQHMG